MPAGRKGKRATPFYIALPPLKSHVAWGRGGTGFGESLRSAVALPVQACQRVERMSILNVFILACAFQFSLIGEWCLRRICTIGGGAFGEFMPSGGEGNPASPLSLALPPWNFHGTGGRILVNLYPRQWRFWCMHASVSGGQAY